MNKYFHHSSGIAYILAIISLLLFAACQAGVNNQFQGISPNIILQTETPYLESGQNNSRVTPNMESTSESIDEDPWVFTFPTPGMNPVSLWRPPLYEAPWALSPHDHFYFVRPIAADEVNWPLADYRYGGIFFGPDVVHTGIDIPNPEGTPVLAAGSGKVIWAGYGLYNGGNDINDPYGLAVTIQHDFGYNNRKLITVYAHMSTITVKVGDIVKAGDQVGNIGTTGFTTGPHLHFEVRLDTNNFFSTRNPELWLIPPQGWGVLVCRFMNTNGSLLTKQTIFVKNNDTDQKWEVITYGKHTVNQDEYYKENMVLSDLPAGSYTISVNYLEEWKTSEATISPGAVTYCTFKGENGYLFELPDQNEPIEIPLISDSLVD
jgi:murein DD-endopeptidase MepM/ murein hydrolase activator NlpD